MFCGYCGSENVEGIRFCVKCGADLQKQTPPERKYGSDTLGTPGTEVAPPQDTLDRSGTGIKSEIGAVSFDPGTLFANRYEILEEGHKGGMGAVYKCRDTKLNETVALKLIHPRLLNSEHAVSRFRQEVAISRKLHHKNIVSVYNLEEWQGLEYFTMEWVEGVTLRDLIIERKKENTPFSLEEAHQIISQLADALQYAHRYTIHRDIKPENVLIQDAGSRMQKDRSMIPDAEKPMQVKLTDFGIAKMLSPSEFTSTSIQMGTPYYMAPEQKVDAASVDKRADIYSLGVVLFELLTLENTIGLEMPSEINESLPKEVDRVVKKAVATRPDARQNEATLLSTEFAEVIKAEQQRVDQEKKRIEEEKRLEEERKKLAVAEKRWLEEEKKRSEEAEQKRLEEQKRREEEARIQAEAEVEEHRKEEEATIEVEKAEKREEVVSVIKKTVIASALVLSVLVGLWILKNFNAPDRSVKVPRSGSQSSSTSDSSKAEESKSVVAVEENPYADLIPKAPTNMVFVKGGCYDMGCGSWTSDCDGDEKPVHEVCVDDFYMDKYEVTQTEFQSVMGSNPSNFKGSNNPVEQVTWNEANEYCGKVSKRLPTEAEWEYAARSGGKNEKYAGTSSNLENYAWYDGNSGSKTHPVGQKKPNGLGIYDMTGNVWEWCSDWHGENYYSQSSRNNPKGPGSGSLRVLGGGSWDLNPGGVRASYRSRLNPGLRGDVDGFRCSRTQ